MRESPSDSELNQRGDAFYAEYVSGVRDFSKRHISDLRLAKVELNRSDFTASQFENCVFFKVIFNDGIFDRARFTRCNVVGSSFHRASMNNVDFNPSAFTGVDFFKATIRFANFLNCALTDSYLGLADLSNSSLYGGRFSGTWFSWTNLTGSTLVGADFENVKVQFFNFINSDTIVKNALLLRQTLGQRARLEEILSAASPVTLNLAASFAKQSLNEGGEPLPIEEIPAFLDRLDRMHVHLRRFLLASGCNSEEVERMDQDADKESQDYPRVFISYSSDDEGFATSLYSVLTEYGVDAWFAPENMRGGRKINEQLEEAIAERDKIILILSEASMRSPWVKSELEWATDREINAGEQILFPIRVVPFDAVRRWKLFDADLGQDVAKYLRQYFVPDFSGWENATALARLTERLLTDLRLSFSK